MVAVDLIKDRTVLDSWPLRRILKYSRLHSWVNTTPEDRAAQKQEEAKRVWADRIKSTQKAYAKTIPKSVLTGATGS